MVHDAGLLTRDLSLVHATHLSDADIDLLVPPTAVPTATVVMCPTTEADLGDGIGRARDLWDRNVRIALGSDQHAVIDPFAEMRGLEFHERLRSQTRGRFTPAQLVVAASTAGYASLGLRGRQPRRSAAQAHLGTGDYCDLVEVSTTSIRTAGTRGEQLPLVATAADVRRVVVGGEVVRNNTVVDDATAVRGNSVVAGAESDSGSAAKVRHQ